MRRTKQISILLILALSMQACSSNMVARISAAVDALPAVVRSIQPDASKNKLAIEGLAVFSKALKEFRASDGNAFRWQAVVDVWDDLQARNVFKLSAQNQSRIDAIVAVISALLGQVLIPTGLPGSGGGASFGSDKVVIRINKEDVKRLEELVK